MELHGYIPRAAATADTVVVNVTADIDEAGAEFRDQSCHVQVCSMPAALTGRVQPIVMGGKIAKRLNADGRAMGHAGIEARAAAEGNMAPT